MKAPVAAVAVVASVVLAFAAGFTVGTLNSKAEAGSSSTASSSVVGTLCTIPDSGDLFLRIVNSTTAKPIPSVPVQVQYLYPECLPNPHTTANLGVMATDANGTLVVGGLGEFYFGISYVGHYSVDAEVGPGETTCVNLSIPSGEVHIWYSGILQPIVC